MILIAAIENHKNAEIDALCADYVKRCGPMHSVKLELLPAARTPDPEAQKDKESETLIKLMKPGDTLILCDERGKSFTSRGFSTYIEKHSRNPAAKSSSPSAGPMDSRKR